VYFELLSLPRLHLLIIWRCVFFLLRWPTCGRECFIWISWVVCLSPSSSHPVAV